MIRYNIDVINELKSKGYSTYRIRQEKIFNETQLQKIRKNELLSQKDLNKLCQMLNIGIGDLLIYIPDDLDSHGH